MLFIFTEISCSFLISSASNKYLLNVSLELIGFPTRVIDILEILYLF